MARDSLKDTFEKAERDKFYRHEQRRHTEPLFFVDPNEAPGLADEGFMVHLDGLRDEAGMTLAESRLQELGFEKQVDGNVTAWRLRRDGWTVLADRRAIKRMDFVVFREPAQPAARHRQRMRPHMPTGNFHLLDSWTRDLRGKFDKRLSDAIRTLEFRKQKSR